MLPVIYLAEVRDKTTIFMMIYLWPARHDIAPDEASAEVATDKWPEMADYLFIASLTRWRRRSQFIP